jgi:hypothetical protein
MLTNSNAQEVVDVTRGNGLRDELRKKAGSLGCAPRFMCWAVSVLVFSRDLHCLWAPSAVV